MSQRLSDVKYYDQKTAVELRNEIKGIKSEIHFLSLRLVASEKWLEKLETKEEGGNEPPGD